MSLQAQITDAWKQAMKERAPAKDVLALIRTELKNAAIEQGARESGLDASSELKVVQRMAKQRKESIASYQEAGRDDLVEKEQFELSVIEQYLPQQLSDEELHSLVSEIVQKTGASSMADMGRVMGQAVSAAAGRADGKAIQQVVRNILTAS